MWVHALSCVALVRSNATCICWLERRGTWGKGFQRGISKGIHTSSALHVAVLDRALKQQHYQ